MSDKLDFLKSSLRISPEKATDLSNIPSNSLGTVSKQPAGVSAALGFNQKAATIAKSWIGTPYRLGIHVKANPSNINRNKPAATTDEQFLFSGSSPGVDCSNLVGAIWRELYNVKYGQGFLSADGIFDVIDNGTSGWKSCSERDARARLDRGYFVAVHVITDGLKIEWKSTDPAPAIGQPWVDLVGGKFTLIPWEVLKNGAYKLMNWAYGSDGQVVTYDEFLGGARRSHHVIAMVGHDLFAESIPSTGVRLANAATVLGKRLSPFTSPSSSLAQLSDGSSKDYYATYGGTPLVTNNGQVVLTWYNQLKYAYLDLGEAVL